MTHGSGPAGGPAPSLLAVVALALLFAGCGGGGDETSAAAAATTLPACANAGAATMRPASLPASFPLPKGTVLKRSRQEGAFDVVEGFVPGDVDSVRDFFRDRLPKAGYALGEGDAEEEEAETEFRHRGSEGRLKVHSIAGCDGALTLSIAMKSEEG